MQSYDVISKLPNYSGEKLSEKNRRYSLTQSLPSQPKHQRRERFLTQKLEVSGKVAIFAARFRYKAI